MKKFLLFSIFSLFFILSWSQTNNSLVSASSTRKIITYFTRPVNNSVSTGTNAIYLNDLVDDTMISYINRAKYSIDMAMYNFNESGISSISAAINNAYLRGVAIRWIYDGGNSNVSLSLLNSNIHTLASPTSSFYGIMHNKFMIIDANSSDSNDPIVWTGSTNLTSSQINTDANNVVIFQDKPMALAYTTEFNEMWGGTGLEPNLTNSKFGPYKSDNTPHIFNVDGITVEVYFSPSDGTNSKLQRCIGSANVDMYFGIYSFTVAADADSIVNRIHHNVYVAGIMDPNSNSYSPKTILTPVMGSNLIIDNITGLYHNKMLIVDPSEPGSDPLVFTGSHNWSASADTKNDENTVIIHDSTLANIYYQSFYQNFYDEGGTLSGQSITSFQSKPSLIDIFPNPCKENVSIKAEDYLMLKDAIIKVFDIYGGEISLQICRNADSYTINISDLRAGLYFIQIKTPVISEIKKLQVIK